VESVSNEAFFKFIFGDTTGWLCIVTIDRNHIKKLVKHKYFMFPEELDDALHYVDKSKAKLDVYFAPFLLTSKRRKKEYILETSVAWSDGDTCPIEELLVQPSAVVRTSEGKHHFYWRLDPILSSEEGEHLSKRIAYAHADVGMDRSGWDLTQLLRVPDTYNHKYGSPFRVSRAVVDVDAQYSIDDFSEYPDVEGAPDIEELVQGALPDKSAEKLLIEYKNILNPKVFELFSDEPENAKDWSGALWELELSLLEAGMSPEEAFVVCWDASCNKYRRDNRPEADLWKEIQKANFRVKDRESAPPQLKDDEPEPPESIQLLTDAERSEVKDDDTFIEQYSRWAKGLGDAAPQYHPAGAFVIISSMLCGGVRLPTSFGTVVPNLWFMILADTTLTRKSTAMDNATDLLLDVDPDILLATDGSIEGLLTAMSTRSGQPSLFLRDEITGLIEAITKKEYMAGMMETLTKLYDGKHMKRILRRETIDVRDPRLVIFAGGIRNKMLELLDYRHVASGFLPRFIFITAESDITRLRPIGPPTTETLSERDNLLDKMQELYTTYVTPTTDADSSKVHFPKRWSAELTEEAWTIYNTYEYKMLEFALKYHDVSIMTPMMDRLAKSGLKASVLLAATRKQSDTVVVTRLDMLHAFYYIEQWIKHTMYMMTFLGQTNEERKMRKMLDQIRNNPGILRSVLMQRNSLSAREADQMFSTMEQRNEIVREKRGSRGERLHPYG
jgi:hypothetical protein